MILEIIDKLDKRKIAKKVLDDLPAWFGIPEYTQQYIDESAELPFFAIYIDGNAIGFASLKRTSDYTIEIHCMGLLLDYHRLGYGKKLYQRLEEYAVNTKFKFIQVKTVKMGCYDEYDKTNYFYKSVGFMELEVLPTLWDKNNPCQIYIKAI